MLWKRGEIAPKEQFLLFSIIYCCLLVDICVKTGTIFSLRDKRLFEISDVEITGVDCIMEYEQAHDKTNKMACAPSEDSDQPGHSPRLIRILTVRSMSS